MKINIPKTTKSRFITSVVAAEEEERREQALAQRRKAALGKRGQPPKTDRLSFVTIIVESLEARGVPFATARNSKMNRCVQHEFNSRGRAISADAVRDLLKQVGAHRK